MMQSKGILSTDLAKKLKIKPSEVINLLGKIRKADFKKNTTRVKISLEESEKIQSLYNKSLTKKKIDDKKQSIIPKTKKKTHPIIKDKSLVIPTEPPKSEDKEKPYQKSAFETYLETLTEESLTTPLSQPIGTVKEEGKSVEEDIHIPDRFKKEIEGEKIEKIKVKPTMQKAFQTIKKIESGKWIDRKTFKRLKDKRKKTEQIIQQQITAPRKKKLKLIEGTTVKEFAELIGQKSSDIIKKFIGLGYMPTINQPVDVDAAILVADSFGIKIEIIAPEQLDIIEEEKDNVTALKSRPPVVTIMGHVDHGKTSLLDAIRKTNVIATEAGGITQHIGAYRVSLDNRDITFLDTPGHEAFTSLRARGAKVTDIVVLVIAADDGVMPQTVEAINHAKAANVPIIVAINKIDKPEANIQRVRNELSEHNIVSEEWGGQNIFVEISAKKLIGIKNILEMILLQSDIMELKANPDKLARGTIIEAKLDKGRGTVATVLIQSGTLKIGDIFVAGTTYGKVRTLINDTGFKIQEAGPSVPVEVIGFSNIPTAGDMFTAISDEKRARQIAIIREQKQKIGAGAKYQKLTLDELYAKIKEGEVKDLSIIIKGDMQGSVEAIKKSFEDITHQEVKVKVLHAAIGGINESDVMLAATSSAIIIGFNVRPELKASQLAEKEGVDIRLYNIIYKAIDDVKKAFEGLLSPTFKEKILGKAEVRHLFTSSKIGNIAGCFVIDGVINRLSDGVRIIRDSVIVYESKIDSLKRFKDDVKEAQSGYECGIVIENFNDLKVGDIIENYIIEKTATKL